MKAGRPPGRPRIAFFDYPDVFEDFYPHYGVSQAAFCHDWDGTANHPIAGLLQRHVGDVTWYERSLDPQIAGPQQHAGGFSVHLLRSSAAHRRLWRWFYLSPSAWRRQPRYAAFARLATYTAPLSVPLGRAVAADRPDVFVVQDYANGLFDEVVLAGRLWRRPVVAYHSGSFPSGYVARAPKRWTIRRADALLVPGRDERRRLVAEHGVDPARIHRVLTPVDTDAFKPIDREAACRASGLDPGRRHVLFVGRLSDPVKRVSSIIRAFASIADRHPDVDLVIQGDGPDAADLRKLARRQAGDRIVFAGWIAGTAAKAARYRAAELLVLASRSEGFPTVVGESLACGTPVLATDVGAVGELVHHDRTGWLVPPGDDAALAAELDRILTAGPQPSVRDEARRTALAEVSPEVVGAQLERVFAGVLRRAAISR